MEIVCFMFISPLQQDTYKVFQCFFSYMFFIPDGRHSYLLKPERQSG